MAPLCFCEAQTLEMVTCSLPFPWLRVPPGAKPHFQALLVSLPLPLLLLLRHLPASESSTPCGYRIFRLPGDGDWLARPTAAHRAKGVAPGLPWFPDD